MQTQEEMNKENHNPVANPYVFLDFQFGGVKVGRVVIELFRDKVPKSAENFRALCTGEKGVGKNGKPLHYKGTKIHKVVPLCMIQGGDIIHNNGSSGESIYGGTFDDENLDLTHEKEGIVGMCNSGPNTNHSQFYITTQPCPHLDTTNVVVGRVIKGFNTIVEMADVPRENDVPLELIEVENCGELKPGEPWNIEENDGTEDHYPPWPNDWEIEVDKSHNEIEKALNAIKNSGNYYFNKNDYFYSERKYIKCLRYIDWYLGHRNSKKLQDMRISLTLNLAAAKLKRQKYKDAVNLCTEVIDKSPENGKAYYRRAQARLAMKDYDDSLKDLNIALILYPNDTNIISVLNETKKYKLNYLKKERNLCSKMLNVGENGK